MARELEEYDSGVQYSIAKDGFKWILQCNCEGPDRLKAKKHDYALAKFILVRKVIRRHGSRREAACSNRDFSNRRK